MEPQITGSFITQCYNVHITHECLFLSYPTYHAELLQTTLHFSHLLTNQNYKIINCTSIIYNTNTQTPNQCRHGIFVTMYKDQGRISCITKGTNTISIHNIVASYNFIYVYYIVTTFVSNSKYTPQDSKVNGDEVSQQNIKNTVNQTF